MSGTDFYAQNTLPFGPHEDVKREVENNMVIFGKGGGFVFNTVHNIQATVLINNLIAMFETVKEKGSYSDLKNIIMGRNILKCFHESKDTKKGRK